MIEVLGLTVVLGRARRPALATLDLDVPAGGVFGLLGPNGAGKTTLLRVLATLQRPLSGTARVAGADVVLEPDAARARVGWLPDEVGFEEGLSCRESVELFAALQGLSTRAAEAPVREVLELVGLDGREDDEAVGLSLGDARRLGLACVLVHEPDVLLLDEPASGLDPAARQELRELLVELAAMGRTVVVSSHVLSDVAATCGRVAILEAGRLRFSGSVQEAVERVRDVAPTRVRVRVLEGPARARRALDDMGLPWDESEQLDGTLVVTLRAAADADREVGLLAARLHDAGLTPTALEHEEIDLEQAFVNLTDGLLA